MSASLPNDEQFYSRIEQGLAGYPRLQSFLPPGYPRTGRSRVDRARALAFEEARTERFLHNINLPLALYLIGFEEASPGVRGFARQMLQDVEAFAAAFVNTPGTRVRQVLDPLWKDPWDKKDPKVWSVIAHANMGIHLRSIGASDLKFEAPIGAGGKTADIKFHLEGTDHLLDLEVWNKAKGATAEEIREEGVRRAEMKAAQKFANLPPGTVGLVVEFCFSVGDAFEQIANNRHILSAFPLSGTERCFGQLCLIGGIGNADGQNSGYSFVTSTSPPLHLRPRTAK